MKPRRVNIGIKRACELFKFELENEQKSVLTEVIRIVQRVSYWIVLKKEFF